MQALPGSAKRRLFFMVVCMELIVFVSAGLTRAAEESQDDKAQQPESAQRVMYVPEIVKAELKEQIKKELLEEMQKGNWAAPNQYPDWLRKIQLIGDVRLRYESIQFPKGNARNGEFPDFNAINTGSPFDVNFIDIANERYLNVDKDRMRFRYRLRLGLEVALAESFQARIRLASGNDPSPVSTNQSFGTNFGKYPFWVDQVFISYAPFHEERFSLAFDLGRIENPFFKTPLVWDVDVNMDGLAGRSRIGLPQGFGVFATGGAFLLQTTALDYPPEQTSKMKRRDKWLYAAQVGLDFKVNERLKLKAAAAYYHYDSVEGRMSSPCDTNLKGITCDTDSFKPAFAQKGNTYMALRTPSDAALAAEAAGLASRYQYFGLASKFRELNVTVEVDVALVDWLALKVEGDYVRNPGFSKKQISKVALNNLGSCGSSPDCEQKFAGGNQGYLARVMFASPTQEKRWDWYVAASYRYLESDATLDAFTDSDFGLGGTNLKGYILEAAVAVAKQVWIKAWFFSSDAVDGPPLKIDVLLIDVSGRF